MKRLIMCILVIGSLWAQWEVKDSVCFTVRVPAIDNCCIYCDYAAESLCIVKPPSGVIQVAQDAVAYAPDWLKIELEDNFSRLDSMYQDFYANMILNEQDPYVDEVAFCITHLAPQTLTNSGFYPSVLLENAEYLYRNDSVLEYVTIIDSGSASVGGNYFSTTQYRICENGDTTDYLMPRDIYYWFIVHPKLQEELPTYIDPASGSPTAPPTGKFWRNYLFNHADAGYPLLRDTLVGFKTLWNCIQNNPDSNGALGRLTRWNNTVQPWGSPHYPRLPQPVYQYHWHTGTCSEHGWFADGAARTVLIPATLAVAYRYNHKWNEFYERRWIQWETINGWIDYYPYDHWGSGDNIPGCFNWRGDGYIWTVTERYTPVCTLKIHVTDAQGNPVDGAKVTINSPGSPGPWVTVGWTTSSGDCQFLLGDSVSYFTGEVQSSVGNVSATTIINNSHPNVTYFWNPVLSGTITQLKVQPDTLPSSPLDDYKFEYTVEVSDEILYGTNPIDGNTFSDFSHPGNIDFFICDQANFAAYTTGDSFYAFQIIDGASSLDSSFTLPTEDSWYLVLSNEDQVVDKTVANITLRLLKDITGITEVASAKRFSGLQVSPNPFKSKTDISFGIGHSAEGIELEIYDVSGRMVKSFNLTSNILSLASAVSWSGTDQLDRPVPAGIYFVRLTTPGQTYTEKVILLK